MNLFENKQHDLLLAITSLLFILFATGLAVPIGPQVVTTVIPTA